MTFAASTVVLDLREHVRAHRNPDCGFCELWRKYLDPNSSALDTFAAQPEPPDTWGEALWTAKELR